MVFLGVVTASGASTLDVTGVFTSTYDQYMLVGQGMSNDSGNILLRFYITGSLSTSSVYGGTTIQLSSTYGNGFGGSSGQSQCIFVGNNQSYPANSNLNFTAYINTPSSTSIRKSMYYTGSFSNGSVGIQVQGACGINDTGALTGVQWFSSSGNISGTIRVYGIRNS
jgi:hypothetical protein